MAKIRQYQQNVPVPHPSGIAAEAFAGAGEATGAGLSSLGQSIGGSLEKLGAQITKRDEDEEKTRLAAEAARIQAEQTQKWRDTLSQADPNGENYDNLGNDFLNDSLNPALDALGQSLKTKGGQTDFSRISASLKANFMLKTSAEQAELAGANSVQNAIQMQNNLSSSIRSDPTNFASSVGLMNFYLDGLSLDPVKKAELKTQWGKEFATARLEGIAQTNPDAAMAELEGGKMDRYLDAGDKQTISNTIRGLKNAQQAEEREKAAELQRKSDAVFAGKQEEIYQKQVVLPNGKLGTYPGMMRDIQNLVPQTPEQEDKKRTMINYGNALIQEQDGNTWKEDQATVSALWKRAYSDLSVDEVNKAVGDHLIGSETANHLRDAITGKDDPRKTESGKDFEDWLGSNKSLITRSGSLTTPLDPTGDARWGDFEAQARIIYRDGLAAGKSMDEIKKRVMEYMPKYQRSGQEIVDSLAVNENPLATVPSIPRLVPEHWITGAPGSRGSFPDNMNRGATAFPKGMIDPGGLNPMGAGDNWATFEVAQDGIHKTFVLPTKPGDRPADDATGFLGDAVERMRKDPTLSYGSFEDEASAQAFMRSLHTKSSGPLVPAIRNPDGSWSGVLGPRINPGESPQDYLKRIGK